MNKEVLYISYDGMTDPLGQSQVLPYVAGLSQKGYRFTLISFEKEEKLAKGKEAIERICRENNIQWHPLLYTKEPPVLSTLKDIRALKQKIRYLYHKCSFDLVHCRSYIAALAGLWMKKKWGVPFVFDMRGFWADERVDGGLWNLRNHVFKTVYRYFKRKEKEFLQHADHVISLTANAKNEVKSWKGAGQFAPIEVIPCCADLELFDPTSLMPAQIENLKQQLDIGQAKKVVSYIGSIGTWYMLDEMLDFFKAFLLEYKDAILLFVTKEEQQAIEKRLIEKGVLLSAVRIIAGERSQMPLLISISDYSIFFITPSYSKKASSPTKQGEIMAMGIPVICNDKVGDTSAIVEKYHSGVVVKEFSGEAYKKAIQQLLHTYFDKAAIRQGAEDFYSLKTGVEKYKGVYEKILS